MRRLTLASLRLCFIRSDPGLLPTLGGLDLGRACPSNVVPFVEGVCESVSSLCGRRVDK